MLCQLCRKNPAVIFLNRLEDGKTKRFALCMSCARKQGVNMKQLFSSAGMTEEQAEQLNKALSDALEGTDPQALQEGLGPLANILPPGMLEMMTGSTPTGGEDENGDMPAEEGMHNLAGLSGDEDDSLMPQGQETDESGDPTEKRRWERKYPYLSKFSTSITDEARRGETDPIVGRDNEIERVMQILNRRTKNNPVLLGEPGVGKTAIAEGLAQRIAQKKVPVKLLHKDVRLLDMTGLVAGTQFRGQFEGRMKGILNEVTKAKNIILVIDEIHNLIGAGDAQNAMNAANILKPALAKGTIQIIGTTTLEEYRKYIEKDSALERRFQPVIVDEPSPEETVEILKGLRPVYEEYHNVSISDAVLEEAVRMSVRYIHQRYLPDKAIDLIDEASSKVNLHNEFLVQIDDLQRQLEAVEMDKEMAAQKNNFEEAANCRVEELRLTDEINKAKALGTHVPLTDEDVAGVVEAWTKIPVHRLTAQEADKLLHLEDQLHKRVIGQEEAVDAVSKAIRRSRSGFRKERKPASFVFAGPTGVGKTELAKALAEEMFGSEDALIRVDMSEYMDSFTSSKLIGAPPGYVGYDEGGQLSEKVRRRPYSVVLLDEIEKAHPDIFNVLLQILDDGRLTDNQGRVVNFENTIIIMTTNAGSQNLTRTLGFGSGAAQSLSQSINAALKTTFRPEFLNRIDEIITFDPLKPEEISKITDLMLKEIDKSAAAHNMTVHVDDAVRKNLSERGYSPEFGARPLRRLIQRDLEDLISEKYLSGEVKDGDHIEVVLSEDGKIALQTVQIGISETAAIESDK